jgi:cold shock CspA family protein
MSVIDEIKDVGDWTDQQLSEFVRNVLAEKYGCKVDFDPAYDTLYNLDFVTNRFNGVLALVNLGIRSTFSMGAFQSQERFLEAASKGVVRKSVYIEFNRDNFSEGTLTVVHSALISLMFDQRYKDFKAVGLRVFEDCTFHYFSLEENIRRLRRENHEHTNEYDAQFLGNIIAYFTDKGFGFIEDSDEQKYFFHIANVIDEDLKIQLPSYNQGESIPVQFFYGGSDGKKYPKAMNVTLTGEMALTSSYPAVTIE